MPITRLPLSALDHSHKKRFLVTMVRYTSSSSVAIENNWASSRKEKHLLTGKTGTKNKRLSLKIDHKNDLSADFGTEIKPIFKIQMDVVLPFFQLIS